MRIRDYLLAVVVYLGLLTMALDVTAAGHGQAGMEGTPVSTPQAWQQ